MLQIWTGCPLRLKSGSLDQRKNRATRTKSKDSTVRMVVVTVNHKSMRLKPYYFWSETGSNCHCHLTTYKAARYIYIYIYICCHFTDTTAPTLTRGGQKTV